MHDLQLVHWLIALVLLTHTYPRDGEFVFCLLIEQHSAPLPDNMGISGSSGREVSLSTGLST